MLVLESNKSTNCLYYCTEMPFVLACKCLLVSDLLEGARWGWGRARCHRPQRSCRVRSQGTLRDRAPGDARPWPWFCRLLQCSGKDAGAVGESFWDRVVLVFFLPRCYGPRSAEIWVLSRVCVYSNCAKSYVFSLVALNERENSCEPNIAHRTVIQVCSLVWRPCSVKIWF